MITHQQKMENPLNQCEIPERTFFLAFPLLQQDVMMSGFKPYSSVLVLSSRTIFFTTFNQDKKKYSKLLCA